MKSHKGHTLIWIEISFKYTPKEILNIDIRIWCSVVKWFTLTHNWIFLSIRMCKYLFVIICYKHSLWGIKKNLCMWKVKMFLEENLQFFIFLIHWINTVICCKYLSSKWRGFCGVLISEITFQILHEEVIGQ